MKSYRESYRICFLTSNRLSEKEAKCRMAKSSMGRSATEIEKLHHLVSDSPLVGGIRAGSGELLHVIG